ncbi:hypothetical protein FJTKL_01834 [Diaporthe vaccinii]|uniref:Uncharacterized protein n=1 Tax=Diaporthe vaccinii TaxID=105482 RepID=A0ABR4F4F7_9PEZI
MAGRGQSKTRRRAHRLYIHPDPQGIKRIVSLPFWDPPEIRWFLFFTSPSQQTNNSSKQTSEVKSQSVTSNPKVAFHSCQNSIIAIIITSHRLLPFVLQPRLLHQSPAQRPPITLGRRAVTRHIPVPQFGPAPVFGLC